MCVCTRVRGICTSCIRYIFMNRVSDEWFTFRAYLTYSNRNLNIHYEYLRNTNVNCPLFNSQVPYEYDALCCAPPLPSRIEHIVPLLESLTTKVLQQKSRRAASASFRMNRGIAHCAYSLAQGVPLQRMIAANRHHYEYDCACECVRQ